MGRGPILLEWGPGAPVRAPGPWCVVGAWLESGVHIKAAADLLGHSSISIIGDLYGHTSDDTARAAWSTVSVRH